MLISFIIPSRNNLKYLQHAYNSIRNNIPEKHEIVMLDDASNDGTWEWLKAIRMHDSNVIIYRNNEAERVGHTVLYDKGVELSTKEIFSIFHADMIATPNYVKNLLKHLSRKKVVCATRIEPPLHPSSPDKYTRNFGIDIDGFKEDDFKVYVQHLEAINAGQTIKGIFAPWAMYKEDFIAIGGHDKLFAPMELEDSDIFNRMLLAGYELIQSRDAFVYHMTCRGSRFKDGINIERIIDLPDGTKWYKPKDSEEYSTLRKIKIREWWRKWGQDILHDAFMHPIVLPKYNIGIVVKNCTFETLTILEPMCDKIYTDISSSLRAKYIQEEQPKTMYNLEERVLSLSDNIDTDIIVEIDNLNFQMDDLNNIRHLSLIIRDNGDIGTFELGGLKVKIAKMTEYQNNLIKSTNNIFI